MKRSVENLLKFILDECLPPILRDSKIAMWLPFKLAFRDKSKYFLDFKDNALELSERSYLNLYSETAPVHIQDENTDLDDELIDYIYCNIVGKKVLDVGCGKGVLARKLSKDFKMAACDIIIDSQVANSFPDIDFSIGKIERLPYNENAFDTVTCTHTLEHVRNIAIAISELRRIAKKRLIIIVPRERPYKYTFNFHLNFFPYRFMVLQLFMNTKKKSDLRVKKLGNCWYCQEDYL